jgi:hypothetical protein
MKFLISAALCFWMQYAVAQKLDLIALEKIASSSVRSADSLLKRSKFFLSDKQVTKNYVNYYYTSYERKDLFEHLLRSLSYMDVYDGSDSSRLLLYRTYYKNDQEELTKQLLANGYELKQQADNSYVYTKAGFTITNKIVEKKVPKGKSKTAYEFELGR